MFSYASLTQAIKDYTENEAEATFVSQIPTFIRFAEERILKSAQLEEFQAVEQVFWEAGDRCADKPCDWLATYALSIRADSAGSERIVLLNKDKNYLDVYWPNYVSTGTPRYYADQNVDKFVIAPTPAVDSLATLHYLRRPTSLVDSGDSETWLSTNAPQALLYAALVEAYGFMKGQQDMLAFYDRRFAESIMRMKNHGEALEPDDAARKSVIRTPPT